MNIKEQDTVVRVAKRLFRPVDVQYLLGDSSKARNILGWNPKTQFKDLVKIMVEHDFKRNKILLEGTKKHNMIRKQHI